MQANNRPNILVIMSDDQGHGDLSCLGAADVRTPALDSLAEQGVLMESFYSNSPVCSPSRASLLTGRYPARAGVRSIIDGHRWAPGLPSGVATLPAILRDERGYNTSLVGKWHLGVTEGSHPLSHGFDEFFGFLGGTIDYFSHINYGPNNRTLRIEGKDILGTPVHDLWFNDSEVWEDGHYVTEIIGERALAEVTRLSDADDPFYLQVTFNAPHFPLHAPQRYRDRFTHLPPERAIIAAMISAMDDQIGALLDRLETLGVAENTIVLFMSDNGPSREIRNWLDGTQAAFYGSSTGSLKGHKFSLFDGGTRVPGILRWPSRVPAGTSTQMPIAAMDFTPSILEVVGVDPAGYELDGESLWQWVTEGAVQERTIFWEQGEQTAVRKGNWKLVLNGRLVEEEGPVEDVFLSRLDDDPAEQHNLAALHPEVTRDLTEAALSWRAGIEAYWDEHWAADLANGTSFERASFHR